jgi:glycosyltransferase involved in cell wall biosynthesis
MSKTLSIIVPCLNEEDNVIQILKSLKILLFENNIDHEVLIIDDQSTDLTYNNATKFVLENPDLNCKVLRKDLDRRGYGAVIKYGIAYSIGEYVTFVSADLVDPIHLIPRMYLELQNNEYDLVQCSRYIDKKDSNTIPFSYKFYQFFFRFFVKICLNQHIPDSTYAFKMFKKAKITSMGLSSNRFNISPEIMFKSILSNMKILYIPGSQGVRENGVSKFSFIKEGPGFIICLFRAFLHRKRIIFWF